MQNSKISRVYCGAPRKYISLDELRNKKNVKDYLYYYISVPENFKTDLTNEELQDINKEVNFHIQETISYFVVNNKKNLIEQSFEEMNKILFFEKEVDEKTNNEVKISTKLLLKFIKSKNNQEETRTAIKKLFQNILEAKYLVLNTKYNLNLSNTESNHKIQATKEGDSKSNSKVDSFQSSVLNNLNAVNKENIDKQTTKILHK